MESKFDKAKKLWEKLGDVPVNEDDEIDEVFEHFEVGTDKLDIWHWFEENFNVRVIDLMFNNAK